MLNYQRVFCWTFNPDFGLLILHWSTHCGWDEWFFLEISAMLCDAVDDRRNNIQTTGKTKTLNVSQMLLVKYPKCLLELQRPDYTRLYSDNFCRVTWKHRWGLLSTFPGRISFQWARLAACGRGVRPGAPAEIATVVYGDTRFPVEKNIIEGHVTNIDGDTICKNGQAW